jgi:hypothetical protein
MPESGAEAAPFTGAEMSIRYELQKAQNNTTVTVGQISLPDNARGADRYLELKRQGFTLRRICIDIEHDD